MSRQCRLLRVEAGESVAAVYAREVGDLAEAMFVRLGDVCVVGRPVDVADMLGRALRECWASWGAGNQTAACDGPDAAVLGRQASALPPTVGPSEVDGPLSRGASAPAKLLALDGGTAISDHPRPAGGGLSEGFYLSRGEGEGA